MKLIHNVPEGHIIRPGLNFIGTRGWVLYIPLWTKRQTRYNVVWMEDQTGDWRLHFILSRYHKVLRWEFYWTAPGEGEI